ncbi:MAG: hypothetical protein M3O67_08755, partial [Bacteroidota bacterium]|nr:hypothetical protein [Bacteroidota bacterium]
DELKDLKKNLLWNQKIFTGEAKPNVIRLLPSLALRKKDADEFLEGLKEEIFLLSSVQKVEVSDSRPDDSSPSMPAQVGGQATKV